MRTNRTMTQQLSSSAQGLWLDACVFVRQPKPEGTSYANTLGQERL